MNLRDYLAFNARALTTMKPYEKGASGVTAGVRAALTAGPPLAAAHTSWQKGKSQSALGSRAALGTEFDPEIFISSTIKVRTRSHFKL